MPVPVPYGTSFDCIALPKGGGEGPDEIMTAIVISIEDLTAETAVVVTVTKSCHSYKKQLTNFSRIFMGQSTGTGTSFYIFFYSKRFLFRLSDIMLTFSKSTKLAHSYKNLSLVRF